MRSRGAVPVRAAAKPSSAPTRRLAAASSQPAIAFPEAIVSQIIRPEQLDETWILQHAYRYGIGESLRCVARGVMAGDAFPRRHTGLRLRALIYGTAAWLTRLVPPGLLRLKVRCGARAMAGILDRLRTKRDPVVPDRLVM